MNENPIFVQSGVIIKCHNVTNYVTLYSYRARTLHVYISNVHFSLHFTVFCRVISFNKRLPLDATLQLRITLYSGIMVSRINSRFYTVNRYTVTMSSLALM